MKKAKYLLIFLLLFFIACAIKKPKDFTNLYDGKYTGLDTLINIDGVYYNKYNKLAVLFYRDGISIYSSYIDIVSDYTKGSGWDIYKGESKIIYGRYIVSGDTIIAQQIRTTFTDGTQCSTYKYLIKSKTEIIETKSKSVFKFYPLENRMDSTTWLLNKKWFYKKE